MKGRINLGISSVFKAKNQPLILSVYKIHIEVSFEYVDVYAKILLIFSTQLQTQQPNEYYFLVVTM